MRPAQALASLVPALGVKPYLAVATRRLLAAVFTQAQVGAANFAAGALTWLVYG